MTLRTLAGAALHGHSSSSAYVGTLTTHTGAALHGRLRAAAGGAQAVTTPLYTPTPTPPPPPTPASCRHVPRFFPRSPPLAAAAAAHAGGALARRHAWQQATEPWLVARVLFAVASLLVAPVMVGDALCVWVVVRLMGSGHGRAHAAPRRMSGAFLCRVLFQPVSNSVGQQLAKQFGCD